MGWVYENVCRNAWMCESVRRVLWKNVVSVLECVKCFVKECGDCMRVCVGMRECVRVCEVFCERMWWVCESVWRVLLQNVWSVLWKNEGVCVWVYMYTIQSFANVSVSVWVKSFCDRMCKCLKVWEEFCERMCECVWESVWSVGWASLVMTKDLNMSMQAASLSRNWSRWLNISMWVHTHCL